MTPEFSLVEKVRLAVRLTCIFPWQLLVNLLTVLTVAWFRGLPLKCYFVCAFAKTYLASLSARQMQFISPSTRTTYDKWVHTKTLKATKAGDRSVLDRLSHDSENLEDGKSFLLWVGDRRKAKKVVLFLHGGGYVLPLLDGHLDWCWRAYVTAGIESNVETAVAVLEYTLCPNVKYPSQLMQAASGLSHLIKSGFSPADVTIGGDSAGGNLTLQLLGHLIRPHPMARTVQLTEPLMGAFLVSPWLTDRVDDRSFAKNGSVDLLSPWSIQKAVRDVLEESGDSESPSKLLSRAFPLHKDDSWLNGLTGVVQTVYVTAGEHEVFLDQDVEFVEKVRRENPKLPLQFDLQAKAAHDFLVMEGNWEEVGECTQAMKTWWKSLLDVKKQL
ncbi:Esterase [Colletotrichum spinosum]|uniref:Esterase n=1 Tax=Colletotrichum spinosum TaxID=1347390 RepID=A0A4R8Q966_9PEZI|nr:Esterase [Colletotrichum spinosum]